MGYILPVSQYQYKDYQVRSIKHRVRPFQVNKPYRVLLEMAYASHQDADEHYRKHRGSEGNDGDDRNTTTRSYEHILMQQRGLTYRSKYVQPDPEASSPTVNQPHPEDEQTYAQVTGKGRTYSTRI